MKRIFLVGCPRSGTTLLQSLLATHTEIVSFPETHIFSHTIPIHPIAQFFKVYGKNDVSKVERLLRDFDLDSTFSKQLKTPVFNTKQWISHLLPVLDQIAHSVSKAKPSRYLLEKTPRHLHFVDQIAKADPDAHFIHIIRNGEDVVASLQEATSKNPGQWNGSRPLKKSIFWWNRAIELSLKCIGKRNHHFVWYKDLVDHTEESLKKLLPEIDLSYDDSLIEEHHETAEQLIKSEESWKSKNTGNQITNSNKFDQFSLEDQTYIKAKLTPFDFNLIALKLEPILINRIDKR